MELQQQEEQLDNTKTFVHDISTLNEIKKSIENMSKFYHIEVLRLLSKHLSVKNMSENENMNGIYINLTELNDNVINDLLAYIKYINTQEYELKNLENEREIYKKLLSK